LEVGYVRICVTDSMLLEHPDLKGVFDKLIHDGHVLDVKDELDYDFVAGPNCWYLIPEVAQLFKGAVEAAVRGNNADKARAVQSSVEGVAKGVAAKRNGTGRKVKGRVRAGDST
jgi:hypothetical protein